MFPPVPRWSTLRTALAITITVSLLLGSTVAWSTFVHAQGQSAEQRSGKPRREKPEGELPDLEEVQSESAQKREAPAAIPSTMRSPKVPHEPWNGRRVGDRDARDGGGQALEQPRPEGRRVAHVRRAHARARMNPLPSVPDDQFVQNFFAWTVSRAPSAGELSYWNDQLRVAYAQGQTSLKSAGGGVWQDAF